MEGEVQTRKSLLDVIRDRFDKMGKERRTDSRIVFVLELNAKVPGAPDAASKYFNELVTKANAELEGVGLTGILFCLPAAIVHLIEGPSKELYKMLREVQTTLSTKRRHNPLFTRGKVVVSTQDIPHRAFPRWGFKVMGGVRGEAKDREPEPAGTMVSEMYHNLLGLGKHFSAIDHTDASEWQGLLDSMRSKHAELLPLGEEPAIILVAPDCATVELFLEIYDSPISITLDADLVWPAPAPLKY
jgi:hypothetical protein